MPNLLGARRALLTPMSIPMGGGGGGITSDFPVSAVLDWDPDSIALTNGAAVGTWTDLLGSVRLSESTNKPTYVTNAFNTHAGVQFDGISKILTTIDSLSVLTGSSISCYLLAKYPDTSTFGAVDHVAMQYYDGTGGHGLIAKARQDLNQIHMGIAGVEAGGAYTAGAITRYILAKEGNSYWLANVNGVDVDSITSTFTDAHTGTIKLGGDGSTFLAALIGRLVFFNSDWSAGNYTTINAWSVAKYGV